MKIKPDIVDKIRKRADLVAVASDRMVLKKKGKTYVGHCPFHADYHKEFRISPDYETYKCFGCGASGDAVKFVMDADGISYADALISLAERFEIKIIEEPNQPNTTMQANIKVLSKKTEIQDLLSQICVSVPDCEKFKMEMVDVPAFSESVMFLEIIADRDLIEEILEIVDNSELRKVETVISSNSETKPQVEFEPFGMP